MTISSFMSLFCKREPQVKTLSLPIPCYVFGCEDGQDGTIYCGVRKDGVKSAPIRQPYPIQFVNPIRFKSSTLSDSIRQS